MATKLEMEDSTIEFTPGIDVVECTGIKMTMANKANPAAVHNSATLFVLVDKVMGPAFPIESFFEKLNAPSGLAISETHDGVTVAIEPNTDPWVITFSPA